MASKSTGIDLIAFSVRVYQLLLNAYPARFHQAYGSEMVQVYQDCCLRVARQSGMNGISKLWAITLLDLIQSVISEHMQKEVQVKKEMKPEDIYWAGWALIWAAVALILGELALTIGGANLGAIYTILITFISMPLLVVGLLAIRNRYGEKVTTIGKNILLMGAVLGPLISLIGIFGMTGIGRVLWLGIVIGPAVLFACLTLFGFVTLYKKPWPRWNVVPVIAGAGYSIITGSYLIYVMNTGDFESRGSIFGFNEVIPAILHITQAIGLVALGNILKSDAPQETAAPA